MKRTIKLILCLVLAAGLLASCANTPAEPENENETVKSAEELREIISSEVRATWMTYAELGKLVKENEDAQSFYNAAAQMMRELDEFGINTLIVHVRAFSDAFYESEIFPSSAHALGTQGAAFAYDPLELLVGAAHDQGLRIEAWINPYRISSQQDLDALADSNPAKQWLSEDENDSHILKVEDGGLYYNPASEDVQELILAGVREIVENYEVDGIHLDDYFYPATSKELDEDDYNAYQAQGGELSQSAWRMEHVTRLIRSLYTQVKEIDADVLVGISPVASISENLTQHYADVNTWAAEEGYVDYLCPQVYFGFDNAVMSFIATVKSWQSLMRNSHADLYFGLPLYKCGQEDEYADTAEEPGSDSPVYEFVNNTDIISRQISYLRQIDPYGGFFLYSSSYLSSEDEHVQQELENIQSILAVEEDTDTTEP
ncbi:MAG: family 10 glycosylhydrolase [Clostridiales bacterium]|nr:family 10 glycosylhydrolase [Clostridiales bacterium]